jgi:hypothetical protein
MMQNILPRTGEERIRRRFFWLPVIVDGVEYWLTQKTVRERYHRCVYCAQWEVVEVLQ